MKNFILLTAVIELLAGIGLFFAPTLVPELANAPASTIAFAKMYGAAALSVGFVAFYIWRNFEEKALQALFLPTFLLFHILVFAAIMLGLNSGGMIDPAASVLHFIMAGVTLYFLVKKKKELTN